MTTKQATSAAKELGFEKTNYITKQGEAVFYNPKTRTYIYKMSGVVMAWGLTMAAYGNKRQVLKALAANRLEWELMTQD